MYTSRYLLCFSCCSVPAFSLPNDVNMLHIPPRGQHLRYIITTVEQSRVPLHPTLSNMRCLSSYRMVWSRARAEPLTRKVVPPSPLNRAVSCLACVSASISLGLFLHGLSWISYCFLVISSRLSFTIPNSDSQCAPTELTISEIEHD